MTDDRDESLGDWLAREFDSSPRTEPLSIKDIEDMRAPLEPPTTPAPVSNSPIATFPRDPDTTVATSDTTSAIDALFDEASFEEYEPEGLLPPIPLAPTRLLERQPERGPRPPIPRTQQILLLAAGGLVGLLALVALYLVGVRLGAASSVAASTPSPTPTVLPTPSSTTTPLGPIAPGVYEWNELLGGECLESFESPWAGEFTVVDCATEHVAQLIDRGSFEDAAAEPYPGEAELLARLSSICADPAILNYEQAAAVDDIQLDSAFPANAELWADGDRSYFCFIRRESGETLPDDLGFEQVPDEPEDPEA